MASKALRNSLDGISRNNSSRGCVYTQAVRVPDPLRCADDRIGYERRSVPQEDSGPNNREEQLPPVAGQSQIQRVIDTVIACQSSPALDCIFPPMVSAHNSY